MFTIRNYTQEDHSLIKNWWKTFNEVPPSSSMLPEETTFILEVNNVPSYCLSLYITNCLEYAYLGNFISSGCHNKEASSFLMNAVVAFAASLGYKNILCMSNVPALQNRYKEMGFTPTISNVQTFVKKVA